MTNKKFIVLNLLFTAACILTLAFSNGILSFGKTLKPELIQKEELLVLSFAPSTDTVSACQKVVYFLGENNLPEETN